MSDATEDLGQYIVMEVVCCFMGALKKKKEEEEEWKVSVSSNLLLYLG